MANIILKKLEPLQNLNIGHYNNVLFITPKETTNLFDYIDKALGSLGNDLFADKKSYIKKVIKFPIDFEHAGGYANLYDTNIFFGNGNVATTFPVLTATTESGAKGFAPPPAIQQVGSNIFAGSVSYSGIYGDFRDFETKTYIYLPFVGIKEIDVSLILNQAVSVYYYINPTSTSTVVSICRQRSNGTLEVIGSISGEIGEEIPIGIDDTGVQVKALNNLILNGLKILGPGVSMALMPQTAPFLAGGLLSSVGSFAVSSYNYQNLTNNLPTLTWQSDFRGNGYTMPLNPFIITEYNDYIAPSTIRAEKGVATYESAPLSEFENSGYLQCSDVHITYNNSVYNLLNDEISELENILLNGIFI